jgi:PAT family beta-lactamase induction signal transducer AmpG
MRLRTALMNRRLLVVMLHGFAAGIPYTLVNEVLQSWLTVEKVSIATIGLFAYVQIPYAWKFVWAPFLDRYRLPFLGRRRGWIFLFQLLLLVSIAVMGLSNPRSSLTLTALAALLVAFFSASHDIVVDAYRADVLLPEERGPGSSYYVIFYRLASFFAGGIALILADHVSWKVVYAVMSVTMLVGVLATLIAPEVDTDIKPPASLLEASWLPLKEFFGRAAAIEILIFALIYKIDANMAQALMSTFFLKTGFTLTELGAIRKTASIVGSLAGTAAGGFVMVKLGMKRSLWVFGLLQGIVGICFVTMTYVGRNQAMLAVTVFSEFFFSGMGTAAYAAFFLAICDRRYSATQYALLTSLMAQSRILISAQMGFLQQAVGWRIYFLISIVAMIPGLLLLTRYDRWHIRDELQPAPASVPARTR